MTTWNKKRRTVTAEVLRRLAENMDMFIEWTENRRAFRRKYFSGHLSKEEWEALMKPLRERQAIQRLAKKKWLQARKDGEGIIYRLHFDAIAVMLREKIRKENRVLPEHHVCLAVFDFPVGANQARTEWRRFLRSAGFAQKQLSVWASSKDVGKDMRALVQVTRAERRVLVYTAREETS